MTEAIAFPAAYNPAIETAVDVEHLAVAIGARASLRAEHAGVDLYRVERRGVERAERCLRPVAEARVAPPPVVCAVAAAEVGILPPRGLLVPPRDGCLEGADGDIDCRARSRRIAAPR